MSEKKSKYTDTEIFNSLKFVGQDNLKLQGAKLPIVAMTLGRKSKNCAGLGICSVVLLGIWEVYGDLHNIILPYEDGMLKNLNLLLAAHPTIDMEEATLSVDEDIDVYDENNNLIGIILANDYSFVETLGEFGGFHIETVTE